MKKYILIEHFTTDEGGQDTEISEFDTLEEAKKGIYDLEQYTIAEIVEQQTWSDVLNKMRERAKK